MSHPPTLSNLAYQPPATYVGSHLGKMTVSATFDFSDVGGDLSTLSLVVLNGANQVIQTLTEPIPGATGITSGTIQGQVEVATTVVDLYSFRVNVTDGRGTASNTLSGTFHVAPQPYQSRAALLTPRYRAGTAVVGGLIYVIGGGDFLGNAFNQVEAYDPATDTWSSRASMAASRDNPAVGVIGGKIYVAGGGFFSDAECYDPATDTWSPIAPLLTTRSHPGGCALGGKLYVVGGNQGFDLSTVEAYDPATNTWSTMAPLPVPRSSATATALNGKLYVIGGYQSGAMDPWLARVDVYDPSLNTWTPGPPLPGGIYQHTTLALNGQLVVFGGGNVNRALDTVVRFDPIAGAWRSGATLPRVMAQHSAAEAGKGFLFDGLGSYVYDPALDLGPLD